MHTHAFVHTYVHINIHSHINEDIHTRRVNSAKTTKHKQVHLDKASWSHGVSFAAWTDWTLLFTHGACKGQHRTLASYVSSAHGGTAQLSSPLSDIPGQISDVFDGAKSGAYLGCFAPDDTSEYVLFSSAAAPGSIVGAPFAVRWAGLVRASLASRYTFHAWLSGSAASHERVKLWLDGQLMIDQVDIL